MKFHPLRNNRHHSWEERNVHNCLLSRVVFKCFGWRICDIYKFPSKLLLPSHSNHGLITLLLQWSQYFGSSHNLVRIFSGGWLFTAFTDQSDFCQFGLSFTVPLTVHTKVFVWKPWRKAAMFRYNYRYAETKFTRVSVLETEKGHNCIESYDGWHVYLFVSMFLCAYGLHVELLLLFWRGDLFSYEFLLVACVNIQLSGLMMCLC